MPYLPEPLLLAQHGPELIIVEGFVGSGVELVQVNGFHAQSAEGLLELPLDSSGGEIVAPLQKSGKFVTEFGRDDPAGTVVAREVIADECLGQMRTVALGRVDQIDTLSAASSRIASTSRLREIVAPFTAELPGAGANNGYAQASAAESPIFHDTMLPFSERRQ